MIIEDFVMLGTTVPEPRRSDGRVFVCSAGWSNEMRQLVRIYPLARANAPRRWSINRVRVERNPKDSRRESWRIAGDRSPETHPDINSAFEVVGRVARGQREGLLDAVTVDSIKTADERRLSLCVVHPRSAPVLTFDANEDSPESPQLRLFDVPGRPTSGAKRFPYIPRLEFDDDRGHHRLGLRDWGVFEFMRKQGSDRRHELDTALHLGPGSSLLLGNMNNRRTTWLVISVLNGIRDSRISLFSEVNEVAS